MSSSTILTSPSASPSSTPGSGGKSSSTVLGIVLGLLAGLSVIAIVIITVRIQRRKAVSESDVEQARQGKTLSTSHPAARITPFGGRSVTHHTPGSDMRIAIRRPDGAWHFTESTIPPGSTASDIEKLTNSPSSSSLDLASYPYPYPPSPTSTASPVTSRHQTKQSRELLSGYDTTSVNGHGEVNAPPAYVREYVGYLNHLKGPPSSVGHP